MPKKFIFAKQGKILRWQYTINTNFGLYTEGFYNCIIIAFKSKDKKRISLIHADSSVSLKDVIAEIQWCGDDCSKIIYLKDIDEARETVTDLFKQGAIKSKFEIILIKKLLNGDGSVVFDHTLPIFPDGSQPAEFESDIVFIDSKMITASKAHIRGAELIDTDDNISATYHSNQKKEWQTAPRIGEFDAEIRQAAQEFSMCTEEAAWSSVTLGNVKQIQATLDKGFNVNTRLRHGYTMLALAAAEGKEKVVDLLLANKANFDIVMDSNSTPLFLAAGRGHLGIVEKLLAVGANPNIISCEGRKADEIAKICGHQKISQLIRNIQQSKLQQKPIFQVKENKKHKNIPTHISSKISAEEAKYQALLTHNNSVRTQFFTLKSMAAEDYAFGLQRLVGKHEGDSIVKISPDAKKAGNKVVSFPSFWLKQLEPKAIKELSRELAIDQCIMDFSK